MGHITAPPGGAAQTGLAYSGAVAPGVAIILAAGRGARMASTIPKALQPLGGVPILRRMLDAAAPVFGRAIVVAEPEMAGIAAAAAPYPTVIQREALGSANAALQAAPMLSGFRGDAVVLPADTPLIGRATLARMREARADGAHLVLLAVRPRHPGRHDRIIACPDTGIVERLVDWADSTVAERAIGLCHAGVFCARSVDLFRWLRCVRPYQGGGEHRLNDIVAIAREERRIVIAVEGPEEELLCVDTPEAFAAAEASLQNATPALAA